MAAIVAYKALTIIILAVATGTSTGLVYYYQNQAANLHSQVATLDQNANTLASQIYALKAAIANLTQQITELQAENARFANQTAYLQTLNSELTGQNTQLQTLESQLSGIVSQLTALNVQASAQLLQLQTEVGQLQLQVSQLKTLIALLNKTQTITTLTGAGSLFPVNLFSAINQNYTDANPSIRINYQALGSGTGVNELAQKTIEFAASDSALSSTQMVEVPNALTIPETIGAVAIVYDLPGVPKGLLLNATVAADIFQGTINTWNDPLIQQLNPTLTLPSNPITLVHRSDASQTTFELSDYLNSSSAWKLGVSKTMPWPAGSLGVNGDQGVAAVVQGTKYTIGYVALNLALSASPPLAYAYLFNQAGAAFIEPTLSSEALAVSSLSSLPAGNGNWGTVNLVNSNNPSAYPIVFLSYVIVYQELNVYGSTMSQTIAKDLANYLWFLVHEGQNQAAPNSYLSLTPSLISVDEITINSMTYNGQVLHS